MKSRLAVTEALSLKPLLFGLERTESPFELVTDYPANIAIKFGKHTDGIRAAFLSPIDYARHGAEYCIVPNICTASSVRTDTAYLIIKADIRDITSVAVDVRFTSEIILANIILKEKYGNRSAREKIQFIPVTLDPATMLQKADAMLVVNNNPKPAETSGYYLMDLVEEWNDMTELPFVHGFWVGREEELSGEEANGLITAKKNGVPLKEQIMEGIARQQNLPLGEVNRYIESFSYDLGEREEESLSEFMHYAYYHGIIKDVPEIRFFDLP
jgi:predicted solute-binding protein